MIVPESVKKDWVPPVDELTNIKTQLETTRAELTETKSALETTRAEQRSGSAALQEVDHQLQSEKEKVRNLESRIALLETTLASLIS